ncbi:MAG TPA: hypothetical protein VME45_09165 [Stellaceae bacterium]|nr:hypothetical protein [Stellaceae bacterium]
MADKTADELRAEIDHLRRLAQLVTDAQMRAELQKMIEELERRLRELEGAAAGAPGPGKPVPAPAMEHV